MIATPARRGVGRNPRPLRRTYDHPMPLHRVRYRGPAYLRAVTALLQRVRMADGDGGIWEAADLQWWGGTPRASDEMEQAFWLDDDGPAAAIVFTAWGDEWGCDPLVSPGISDQMVLEIWSSAVRTIDDLGLRSVETLV